MLIARAAGLGGAALAPLLLLCACMQEAPSRFAPEADAASTDIAARDVRSGSLGDGARDSSALEAWRVTDSTVDLVGRDRGAEASHCTVDPTAHTGEGTYYLATGGGACGFPPTPGDLMVTAMNAPDYGSGAVCGKCVRVKGPKAEAIIVRIVDLCPGCAAGDLDLSEQAFTKIADLAQGRVAVSWQYTCCEGG